MIRVAISRSNDVVTFMNTEKGSDAVSSAVQIVHSVEKKRISGQNVDSGVSDGLGDDAASQIDVTHEHASVRFLLFGTGSPEMNGTGHIGRTICTLSPPKMHKHY